MEFNPFDVCCYVWLLWDYWGIAFEHLRLLLHEGWPEIHVWMLLTQELILQRDDSVVLLKVLLCQGAETDTMSGSGWTPLIFAATGGHTSSVSHLIASGNLAKTKPSRLLFCACASHCIISDLNCPVLYYLKNAVPLLRILFSHIITRHYLLCSEIQVPVSASRTMKAIQPLIVLRSMVTVTQQRFWENQVV